MRIPVGHYKKLTTEELVERDPRLAEWLWQHAGTVPAALRQEVRAALAEVRLWRLSDQYDRPPPSICRQCADSGHGGGYLEPVQEKELANRGGGRPVRLYYKTTRQVPFPKTKRFWRDPLELESLDGAPLGASGDLFFMDSGNYQMPSFYIQSLFDRQLEELRLRQERVLREIEHFIASVKSSAGEDAASILRAYMDIPWGYRYRGEWLPIQDLSLFDQFVQLSRREAALCRKMRNSAFRFSDSLMEPYVFWCYGLNWHDISCMTEDGKLPLKHVRRLLEMLLERKPRFPTPRQVAPDEVKGWERTFRHKRRHLVRLFRTAVRLGEDLVCGM
jgi:hypothetical protein